jgi:hypothetical protein
LTHTVKEDLNAMREEGITKCIELSKELVVKKYA